MVEPVDVFEGGVLDLSRSFHGARLWMSSMLLWLSNLMWPVRGLGARSGIGWRPVVDAFECGDAAWVPSCWAAWVTVMRVDVGGGAGAVRGWWRVVQSVCGAMPLEAADDLFSVLSFPLAPATYWLVAASVAYPGGSDRPERVVGLAVTSPVETMPDGLSR